MNSKTVITFREYHTDPEFPFLYMYTDSVGRDPQFLHFHNCLELALCESGIMQWTLEGREFELKPGQMCLVPAFVTHSSRFRCENDGSMLCHYIYFDPEELLAPVIEDGIPQELLWFRFAGVPLLLSCGEQPEAGVLMRRLISVIKEKPLYYREEIRSLCEYLLVLLCRFFSLTKQNAGSDIPGIRCSIFPAVSYIEKHCLEDISPETLCSLCHMNRKQLTASFRRAFAQTPLQYIRQVRIQEACRLLGSSEDSVLSIAYASGFSSVSSFNRCFKALTGKTPAAFRNEIRHIPKSRLLYSPYTDTGDERHDS